MKSYAKFVNGKHQLTPKDKEHNEIMSSLAGKRKERHMSIGKKGEHFRRHLPIGNNMTRHVTNGKVRKELL